MNPEVESMDHVVKESCKRKKKIKAYLTFMVPSRVYRETSLVKWKLYYKNNSRFFVSHDFNFKKGLLPQQKSVAKIPDEFRISSSRITIVGKKDKKVERFTYYFTAL